MKTILRSNVGWSESRCSSGGDTISSAFNNTTWSQSWDYSWNDGMCWAEGETHSNEFSGNGLIYPGGSSCFGFNWG